MLRLRPVADASSPPYPARARRAPPSLSRLKRIASTAATAVVIGLASASTSCRGPGMQMPTAPPPMDPETDDSDGDGLVFNNDACPFDAEDLDQFQDDDGCPDPDNDADGIQDAQDQCPNDAEDRDGFQDEDGCPDPDNDADRIADTNDQCPNEPEVYNGNADEDGCPDEGLVVVRTAGVVTQPERVYFTQRSSAIEERSRPILDAVADILSEHAEITLIEVQGHGDSVGPPARNLAISRARAAAVVRYLVGRGVDPQRLRASACGDTCPISPPQDAQGRERNRRVDFSVIAQEGSDSPAGPSCPTCTPFPVP